MEFFVITIVWGLLKLRGPGCPSSWDYWFDRWLATLNSATNQPLIVLPIAIVLPSIAIFVVSLLFESVLLGLVQLTLSIIVLFYSVGRIDVNANMHDYLTHWNKGHTEAALATLTEHPHLNIAIDSNNQAIATHEHRRQLLFYEHYERWFAAAFWFIILGPAGALAYRLSMLCTHSSSLDSEQQQPACKIVHYLDWIPARLWAFVFTIMGNFVSGFSRWLETVLNDQPTPEFLDDNGCASLDASGRDIYPSKPEDFVSFAGQQLLAAQELLSRCVITWLVLIAMIQLW